MKFPEFVDITELRELCDSFTTLTGAVTAILDLEGNILVATGWHDICTRFHRVHPVTASRCRESDTVLAGRLGQGEPYNVYMCKNGLVDVAVPINVGGEHVANLFTGQFFFNPPDEQYFIRQAEEFAFDRTAYLKALRKVPIFSEEQVKVMMGFLSNLARLIGEMGLAARHLEESNVELRKHQEHLEELVKDRSADLKRAQEIAHIGSWRWNVETGSMEWSDEMHRLFGLQPGQPARITLETFLSRVCEAEREAVFARLNEARNAKQLFDFELRTVPIDNRERIVRVFGEVRRDCNGEPKELFGANQDITEEKHARQSLAEAKERAEDASRAKSVFLANMSHELRTPMSVILGYSQLMQRDTFLSPTQQEFLGAINRSGEHLLALINEVLEISRIEARQITADLTTFDLQALFRDLELMFRVRTDVSGLYFKMNGVDAVPRYVVGDDNKLRQILINLLSNAVKFTEQGGIVVRVRTRSGVMGKVCLQVEVEDTGIGISEDELGKVFQYFEQTASGRRSKSGSGLGLAISRSYARVMGGDITVTSNPGKGSTFQLEVTVGEAEGAPMEEKPQPRRVVGLSPGCQAPRVLVVEDMEESRVLLVQLLEGVGFQVREAVNGTQAIEITDSWRPHFIWMDVRMPVMDGLEATRRIKESEAGKFSVIAVLTAHAMEEEKEKIIEVGCDDFVRKPYRECEIFDVMARHLGVAYRYEEEEELQLEEEGPLRPEHLAALPADLRKQLCQAVLALDTTMTLALIEKIIHHDAAIGSALNTIARKLDYKRLLSLLEGDETLEVKAER